jgi:hypothetical protein
MSSNSRNAVCCIVTFEQSARFGGEECQSACGDCVNGLEFTLYGRFVLGKAFGDVQDLCSERQGDSTARD